uniref:NOT2_3_5 domain-containing protein n=1 Tax=Ascaris lumbricoides TaxID=6252 RepID=A0A0M3IIC9_ASCLU
MAKCSTVSTSTDLSNATFSNSTGEYAHVYLCLIIPSTATIEGESTPFYNTLSYRFQAYSNYCSPPQPGRPQMMPTNYYAHNRNISNDSAVDNTMEVDYITSAHMGMAPLQGTHHIDPNLVRDLTAQDLNPRDFDQYLQLNDNRSPAIAKQYM